jgi:hypothetical protein
MEALTKNEQLTTNHFVRDVVRHPAFKGFGELLLPWEENSSLMPYHGHVNADVVVGALNHLIDEAGDGRTVFYDFYTERQKREDPTRKYTGLFFYRVGAGAKFTSRKHRNFSSRSG